METKKVGFFEEESGVKSSTRLNSFILLFFFMAFNLVLTQVEGFKIDTGLITLDTVLLIAIFTPKYLHKLAEMKLPSV